MCTSAATITTLFSWRRSKVLFIHHVRSLRASFMQFIELSSMSARCWSVSCSAGHADV